MSRAGATLHAHMASSPVSHRALSLADHDISWIQMRCEYIVAEPDRIHGNDGSLARMTKISFVLAISVAPPARADTNLPFYRA